MIYFNGIELDYDPDTLYKLVIKRALTDIETLSDRKGTSSTTFKVPRTANNEKALGFITKDGSISEPSGAGIIKVDGNIYSQGTMYIKGYDNTTFDLLFMGADIDLINTLDSLELRDLISEKSSDSYNNAYTLYNDFQFKYLSENYNALNIKKCIVDPFTEKLSGTFKEGCGFAFNVKELIYKIAEDNNLNVVSNFLSSTMGEAMMYSNKKDDLFSCNMFNSEISSITSDEQYIGIGSLMIGETYDRVVHSPSNRIIYASIGSRTMSKITIRFKLNLLQDDKVDSTYITILANEGVVLDTFPYYVSKKTLINEGDNVFETTIICDGEIGANTMYIKINSVLKSGESLPISSTITASDCIIKTDILDDDDVILFGDSLTDVTQLDFLSNIMKQFNLVLDVDGDNMYIDLQDNGIDVLDGLAINEIQTSSEDISDIIEHEMDISFDYDTKDSIYFKQSLLSLFDLSNTSLKEYDDFGSILVNINGYSTDIEEYSTDLNIFAAFIPLIGQTYDLDYLNNWENLVFFQYPNEDTNTVTLDVNSTPITYESMVKDYDNASFDNIVKKLFTNTLNQRKDKKIKEVQLYDHQGTLMSFRKNYIINDQLYKLISYEFEPITKKVIAQLILK